MTIGSIIRERRTNAGMSQEELAKMLGKSKNVISNWERGDNKPDADMIEKLCGILNITPNTMLNWSEPDDIQTIAAHRDGDGEYTEEELAEIEQFKAFVRMRKAEKK